MAPVARRTPIYDAESPQRELQEAVEGRYLTMRAFFEAVAAETQVTWESAKGTFYDFLRTERSLPDNQRAAYLKLAKVRSSLLDEIEALRPAIARDPGHLEELAETVDYLLERQAKTEKALAALRGRVRKLEDRLDDGGVAAKHPAVRR